jgi:pimeloyl-ACP methyl ester carboxylesterase
VPDEALADLRHRIAATRWPDRETVPDSSQGVPLATIQALTRYWATEYDWRKCEAKLNALPQFITEIDGLDIHFIHVRSEREDALPLIVTHGWPGSVIEQLKIIDPLTNPTANGASAADAFHVVIPSMPGYGFSGKPTSTGWGPQRMGRARAALSRLYWEYRGGFFNAKGVSIPVAVSVFPGERYQSPRSWAETAYPNLIYFNEVDKGGHFAAWEQPLLFSEEVRAAFRSLR